MFLIRFETCLQSITFKEKYEQNKMLNKNIFNWYRFMPGLMNIQIQMRNTGPKTPPHLLTCEYLARFNLPDFSCVI